MKAKNIQNEYIMNIPSWQIRKWRPESNFRRDHLQQKLQFSVCSYARLMQLVWKMSDSHKNNKRNHTIVFDIVILEPKWVIYSSCFQKSSKVAAVGMLSYIKRIASANAYWGIIKKKQAKQLQKHLDGQLPKEPSSHAKLAPVQRQCKKFQQGKHNQECKYIKCSCLTGSCEDKGTQRWLNQNYKYKLLILNLPVIGIQGMEFLLI